jgi:diguanylate cyclase (GGDEF)-like protein
MVVSARDVASHERLEAERADAEATAARLHAELHERAIRDALTGLFNRDEALRLLAAGHVGGVTLRTAVELDVDALAHVNETYGHEVGDAVLREVADRLRAIVPPGTVAARMGPDEFLLLLPCEPDGGASVVEHAMAAIRAPFDPHGRVLRVSVCAGVSEVAIGDAGGSLRRVDLALSEAKRRGRDQWAMFEHRLDEAARTRVALEQDLRTAIARDQMRLHFQPSFELATARVCGMEALVRWEHPVRGLLPPGLFVPVAEASGQIADLGRWVARHACETRARLGRLLPGRMEGVTMWINASAHELEQPWYSADLIACVRASGLAPGDVGVELTESTLVRDLDAALEHLRVLTAAGIRVAIDDFGTGYSSFAYLARLPIDVLKIDAGLTHSAAADRTAATVVRSITELAHRLGASTCLEGIETAAQLDVARLVGADMVSGFLFARPQPEHHLVHAVAAA